MRTTEQTVPLYYEGFQRLFDMVSIDIDMIVIFLFMEKIDPSDQDGRIVRLRKYKSCQKDGFPYI